MSRLVWSLIGTLVCLPLLAGAATSEEAVAAPVPAGDVHQVYLIALNQSEPARVTPEDTYSNGKELRMGLSDNASESVAPSVSTSFNGGYGGLCVYPYPLTGSCSQPVTVKAKLTSADFELAPVSTITGSVHLAWTYRSSTPAVCCEGDVVASVYPELDIAGQSYTAKTFGLKRAGGDMVVALDFEFEAECDRDDNGTPTDCTQPVGAQARDAVLLLHIMPVSYFGSSGLLGSTTTIKFDTAGGSSLALVEVVPPVVSAADALQSVPDEDISEDDNITAEGAEPVEFQDPGQVEFASAPMVPLMIAGCLGVVAALRRRWSE
jgi:hypothetical protein